MRAIALLCFLAVLSGCSIIGEHEPKAPLAHAGGPMAECEIPPHDDLTRPERVTQATMDRAIDCFSRQIHSAFAHLKGERPEELSVAELRRLVEANVVHLPLHTEARWTAVRLLTPLIGPKGRPSISLAKVEQAIAWLRRYSPLLTRAVKEESGYKPDFWLLELQSLKAYDELVDLLSPEFRLSLDDAETLGKALQQVNDEWHPEKAIARKLLRHRFEPPLHDSIEASWILKSMLLPDAGSDGPRADLTGKGIIDLARLGIQIAREMPLSTQWGREHLYPQSIPRGLDDEWANVAHILSDYFTSRPFSSIEAPLLQWALSVLIPDSRLPQLAPDLARLSEKLAPTQPHRGLHPLSLLAWLSSARTLAQRLARSATSFPACRPGWMFCGIPTRTALRDPELKQVALKGPFDWWFSSMQGKPPLKAIDLPFEWHELAARQGKRVLVEKVFDAFAQEGGKLPLTGDTDEDVQQTLDLAFTLLRFIATQSAGDDDKLADHEHTRVPAYLAIKPGPLSRVMGMIGDEWMPDGNRDGALQADEFFSVVQVYDEMQSAANEAVWRSGAPEYVRAEDWTEDLYFAPTQRLFERTEFVRALSRGVEQSEPAIGGFFAELPRPTIDSLFHALVGISKQRPIDVKRLDEALHTPARLDRYVEPGAALAPVAVLNGLNRLMILCDRSPEDGLLDWKELDCALPLMLSAGYQTISTELLSLDPGVHDGALLLLGFLRLPGMPLSLAKLIAINGGVRDFYLDRDLDAVKDWADHALSLDWNQLAYFLGATDSKSLSFWRFEAKRRYETCDVSPTDGRLTGKPELDCFSDRVVAAVLQSAGRLMGSSTSMEGLARFSRASRSPLLRLGIKLAAVDPVTLDSILARVPLRSSPAKILRLLEEIVRRGTPLP